MKLPGSDVEFDDDADMVRVHTAQQRLLAAVVMRLMARPLTVEDVKQLAEALERAARDIEDSVDLVR